MSHRFTIACLVALLTVLPSRASGQDWAKLLETAKAPLTEAIAKALAVTKEGVPVGAEIEDEDGKIRYAVDVAKGAKKIEVVLDAKDWSLIEQGSEDEDQSKLAAAAKVTLAQAIETALGKSPGKAVLAELGMEKEQPRAVVTVFAGGKITKVTIDAVSGAVIATGAATEPAGSEQDEGAPFTDSFGEDDRDLVSVGTNPYFILEPGYFIELTGKDKGQDVVVTITVLDETKRIAGICARAVEEKEVVGGKVKEITKDYFVISKRTNNVYYMGEDVDIYKDGKVVNHEGAWLAGEKGARYGLFMQGVPLLGSRYYQEIAPGVAMDRAEIVSMSEKLETPAGKFDQVMKIIETSAIEKGAKEPNYYVRGIGVVKDDELTLSRYGRLKK